MTLAPYIDTVRRLQPLRIVGRVHALRGLTLLCRDLPIPVGSLVQIGDPRHAQASDSPALGEVVGFDGPLAIIMMLGSAAGIRAGDPVVGLHAEQTVPVGDRLLGRVIDGLGRPIDGGGPVLGTRPRPIDPAPISPLRRARVTRALSTGVRAMDAMTTLGRGQRLGVFAGPGVGKSTLLGSIARNTEADVSVVALIGERGREVKDFVEHTIGPEALRKCVIVAATGDESAVLRARAALVACAVAEHFRDEGRAVLLIMDSATRFAHAQRQIGLAAGEPPATRGYTPSVFSALARLLERAGAVQPPADARDSRPLPHASRPPGPANPEGGSITGIYSVLVEGDDMTEPVADAARGILDGHVILSRKIAQRGQFPAIDVLDSVSRVADDVTDQHHVHARRQLVRLLAAYRDAEDLIQIGAYARGSNPVTDVAIKFHEPILDLLRQNPRESEPLPSTRERLVKLAIEAGNDLSKAMAAKK